MQVHRSTAIEFLQRSDPNCCVSLDPVWRHELYIDGSASTDHCAWAIVHVTRHHSGQRQFVGLLAGNVTLASQDPHWIGAQQLDNIAAELTAMCVAHSYAISLNGHVCICPDLRFGHDLVRRQVTSGTNLKLARLRTALGRIQFIPIEEVRAHRGDPYNELADKTAKWAGSQGISLGLFDWSPVQQFANSDLDVDWAWISQAPPSYQQALPHVDSCGQLQVLPATERLSASAGSENKFESRDFLQCHLCVATANVQSVREHSSGHGTRCAVTTKRLDQQWYQHGIDIVGVQEARTPQGQDLSPHYNIYCSGVDISQGSAHFGCEIWLRKDAVIATSNDGTEVRMQSCKVVVHVADPRRLILRISQGALDFVIASLHAPCLSTTNAITEVEAWWSETARLMHKLPLDNAIVCIDANAPLGQASSPLVGEHGSEQENSQSRFFHDFLSDTQLAVPCTFDFCHSGSSFTWKHPSGAMCRRDYVLVASPLLSWANQSYVIDDFDRARSHVDHLPAVLCMQGWISGNAAVSKRSWDESKLRDPQICEQFRQALATLPIPSWHVAADDHCQLWEDQLLRVAMQFFARTADDPKPKRRPALSTSTLALIQFKRHLLYLARHAFGIAYDEYKEVLRDVEKQVRRLVMTDQKSWYDDLIQQVQDSGELQDSAHMFRLLRRLGSRKYKAPRRPLPMLKRPDGTFTSSVEEMQEVFRAQFASIEGGVHTTIEDLSRDHHCHPLLPTADVDTAMLISPWDIAQAISKMKRGKVPGKNGITTEILKCAGDVAASQMVPLLMKCVLHQFEPLSWKGGTLVPLFKGKGRVDSPSAYRSIFISDTTCKAFHSCLRSRLLVAWEKAMSTLQFGGRPGFGTDMAHHYAHAFLSWARWSVTPASLIFLDLTAAFYSVLRQGLFQNEICDQHLCYAFQSLGISSDELREVISTVSSEAAVEGVSMHCDLVMKGLFEGTHFAMVGLPGVTHTSKGTRPGDPVADLLFNMAMSLIQRSVRRKLADQQLHDLAHSYTSTHLLDTPALPPHGYTSVAYVDDVVIMAHAVSNDQVRIMTQTLVSTFYDEARHRGLLMNFEAKKTEAILQPAGKGTRSFRDLWFRENHGRLPVVTETSVHYLNLVHKYRHLGTQIQHGADIAADSREKTALARQAWGPLCRSFFAKRTVTAKAKATVFKSLVASRLLYNSHVWSWWREAPAMAWSNTARSMMVTLLGALPKGVSAFQMTTEELCALAGILAPSHQVHVNRLMYVKRLVAKGPSILWAYLWHNNSSRAWLQQLLLSCHWLCKHFPGVFPLSDQNSLQEWISFVAVDQNWRGRVKKAARAALSHLRLNAEGKVWQLSALARLTRFECYQAPPVASEEACWQCETCSLQFKSKRALAMHSSKVHGYVRRSKYLLDSDVCHACLRKYHTLARALTHLDHNPYCADVLEANFGFMSEAEVAESSAALREQALELKKAGWQATKAFCPVVKIQGPTLPPIGSPEADEMRAKWDARREPGTGCHHLSGFAVESSPAIGSGCVDEELTTSFVMNTYGGRVGGQLGCATDLGLSFLCAQITVRSLFFVHFFSGYRRQGDLQHWLENEIVGEGYRIYCISVDICLCKSNFDLTDKKALEFWVGKAKQGFVIGGGGGPPCETMSAARFQGPPGPPPVRSGSYFWGLPGNRKRHNLQVDIGSRLLMFLLAFLQEMVVMGLCGFLEHPAYPLWLCRRDPPSIWSTPFLKALARLSCVRITTIDQCVYGCDAMKPTTFLTVRMVGLQRLMTRPGLRGRCNHRRGYHKPLSGKDSEGKFHTARAKIYPPKLNQVLASGIREYTELLWSDRNTEPEHHDELAELLTFEFVQGDIVQPDFHL